MERHQLTLGCHLSSAKGFLAMGKTALSIGANTFQFFTRNPRGGRAKALDTEDAAALSELMRKEKMAVVLAHAPYTLNACAKEVRTREFAAMVLRDDLKRMECLPGQLYNFHPGSHVGQGIDAGIEKIAALLNEIVTPRQRTTILLETMAGKGTEVGAAFEELREIRDRVVEKEKIGVCLDTCHVHDAGYDLAGDLDGVIEEFDRVIGLEHLRAIHLNDSMNAAGSHKDRHEKIGGGRIGLEALVKVIRHPALRQLPFFLETPNELSGYAAEIALLRRAFES